MLVVRDDLELFQGISDFTGLRRPRSASTKYERDAKDDVDAKDDGHCDWRQLVVAVA